MSRQSPTIVQLSESTNLVDSRRKRSRGSSYSLMHYLAFWAAWSFYFQGRRVPCCSARLPHIHSVENVQLDCQPTH